MRSTPTMPSACSALSPKIRYGRRARINLALLRRRSARFMLHVMHGWGGGIETAVRDLCSRLAKEKEGALVLRAGADGSMLLSLADGEYPVRYPAGTPIARLCEDLRALGVWHVHIHQTVGLSRDIWGIAKALGASYDFTLHDYFTVCPRVNFVDASGVFCDQADLDVCEQCVSAETLDQETRALFVELGGTVAAWRKFHLDKLEQARTVFAPSEDTLQRFRRYLKLPQLRLKPHPEEAIEFHARTRSAKRPLRVAVIGAIGLHKGHRLLLATAAYAKRMKLPVEFVVVGYTCDDRAYAGLDNVEIMGAYEAKELPALLTGAGCNVALFLSIWLETYSYTLSEALRAGLVPVATALGVQAERIKRERVGVVLGANPRPQAVLNACVRAATLAAAMKKTIKGQDYAHLLTGYYALNPSRARRVKK